MTVARLVASVVILGAGAIASWAFALTAADNAPGRVENQPAAENQEVQQEEKTLSHFMRVKLEASSKILEGLALEDFELIKQGAQQLNTMSKAEKWRVSNDVLYRNFSEEFQRVTQDLVNAAGEENLDRVALKWMDATMSCIECHRYARGVMIAQVDR